MLKTCPPPSRVKTHRFEYSATSFLSPADYYNRLSDNIVTPKPTHIIQIYSQSEQQPHFPTHSSHQMLPFATLQEAEAALGRSLTAAETLWFNYSATKSDYILYCHNIIFLFLLFSLCPFYYLFLEFFFAKSVGPYKIQPKVKLSFSDTLRCYKSVMRMFFLVVGPLQLVSYPSIQVINFLFFPSSKSTSFFQCGLRFCFSF